MSHGVRVRIVAAVAAALFLLIAVYVLLIAANYTVVSRG
jgi:hypothetical protein